MKIQFAIAGSPVSVNQKDRVNFNTRTWYKDKKAVDYQEYVAWCALKARPKGMSLKYKWRVILTLHWSDKRVHDIDNCAKLILDGMKKVIYDDDKQVLDLHIVRRPGETRAVVKLETIGSEEIQNYLPR